MVTGLLFGMRILLIWAAYEQAYYRSKLALQLTNHVAFFCLFRKCQKHLEMWCCFSFHKSSFCMRLFCFCLYNYSPSFALCWGRNNHSLMVPSEPQLTVPASGKGPLIASVHLTGCICIWTPSIRSFICSCCCRAYTRSERLQEFPEAILSAHLMQSHSSVSQSWSLLLGFSCTLQMLNHCSTQLCYLLRLFQGALILTAISCKTL